ncbi:ornithine cyclodeaminase family protein [Pimelobacter sp. 30-1]|uniref:ornithine cyclodeaminase family protein n=1 Tax=Pimelobacter sp. 30-1 TaxID=2004991 RepID=UPI001C0529D0|nr:ornithine cyclodeaminase family protein [Pimelobacter sp. 30-1]
MSQTPAATALLALSRDDVVDLLSLTEAIATQRAAFVGLATGEAYLAPRILSGGAHDDTTFVYVARLSPEAGVVTKIGSVVPGNADRGLPTIHALVVAVDPLTGRPAALLNGEAVTELRTVAASMLAAQTLRPGGVAHRIALVGYGRQGRGHGAAARRLFPDAEITFWDPVATGDDEEHRIGRAGSAQDAVAGADLVITCTTSTEPVIAADWLADGATVISVGSFGPQHREVGDDVLSRASVVVDHAATAVEQAGPVRHAIATGALAVDDVRSLGEAIVDGYTRPADRTWTYYNTVGIGIQDAAVTAALLERAAAAGVGSLLPW